MFILPLIFILQVQSSTASNLLSVHQSKAIDTYTQPLTTLQATSQTECLLKHRLINTEPWLVETKQWGPGNWSCRYFSFDDYALIRRYMIDEGKSNVYVNLTKEHEEEVEMNRREDVEMDRLQMIRQSQLYANDISCLTLYRYSTLLCLIVGGGFPFFRFFQPENQFTMTPPP